MDGHTPLRAVRGGHQAQRALFLLWAEHLLLITRSNPALPRHDPDLQKVHRVGLGCVVFAVEDATASTHALHVPRLDDGPVAHGVLVRQGTRQHVGDDFHVPVRVGGKSPGGGHAVLIDDPQRAEAHALGIVIIRKRKRVPAVQPAMVCHTAVLRLQDIQHGILLGPATTATGPPRDHPDAPSTRGVANRVRRVNVCMKPPRHRVLSGVTAQKLAPGTHLGNRHCIDAIHQSV